MNEVFKRGIAIADELKQNVVLEMDLAFYAKAQQVCLNKTLYKERTSIRLGEFHTCMLFLGVMGKRFSDAGLRDILIAADVITTNSK